MWTIFWVLALEPSSMGADSKEPVRYDSSCELWMNAAPFEINQTNITFTRHPTHEDIVRLGFHLHLAEIGVGQTITTTPEGDLNLGGIATFKRDEWNVSELHRAKIIIEGRSATHALRIQIRYDKGRIPAEFDLHRLNANGSKVVLSDEGFAETLRVALYHPMLKIKQPLFSRLATPSRTPPEDRFFDHQVLGEAREHVTNHWVNEISTSPHHGSMDDNPWLDLVGKMTDQDIVRFPFQRAPW